MRLISSGPLSQTSLYLLINFNVRSIAFCFIMLFWYSKVVPQDRFIKPQVDLSRCLCCQLSNLFLSVCSQYFVRSKIQTTFPLLPILVDFSLFFFFFLIKELRQYFPLMFYLLHYYLPFGYYTHDKRIRPNTNPFLFSIR